MTYLATFYTHFGAVSCSRSLRGRGIHSIQMPVPRKLSSSCGTCIRFQTTEALEPLLEELALEDLDTVYLVEEGERYAPKHQTPRK